MKNVSNYIKNLGKSVTYAAVDQFKSDYQSSGELIEKNADLFKEIYAVTKNYKRTMKKASSSIKNSKIYEAADVAKTALFEDLKSGKLYNKERKEAMELRSLGELGNMDDFGDEFNFESNTTTIDDGDRFLSGSFDSSIKDSTAAISETVLRTSDYIAETTRTSAHMLYNQNNVLFSRVGLKLDSLTSSINSSVKYSNDTLSKHANTSSKFFTDTNKLLTEQNAMIKEMLEMQRNMYKSAQQTNDSKSKSRTRYDDIVGVNGMPDLKQYFLNVKNNATNMTGGIGELLGGGGLGGSGGNMLLSAAGSPLAFIPSLIAAGLLPATTKKAMKDLDKSMTGFFGALISKLNHMAKDDDGSIISKMFGKMFGINNSVKTSISARASKETPMAFDGITHKTINNVIPAHLRRIEALLGGKEERIYNHKTGKWTNHSEIKKSYTDIRKDGIREASSDIKPLMDELIKSISIQSAQQKESMEQAIEKMMSTIYSDGGWFNPKDKKNRFQSDGVSDNEYELFRKMYSKLPKNEQIKFHSSVATARTNENKKMNEIEESGFHIIQELFNGSNMEEFMKSINIKKDSKGNSTGEGRGVFNLIDMKDNLGNNIFYYLQNMNRELTTIRNMSGGGGYSTDNVFGSSYHPQTRNTIKARLENSYKNTQIKDNSTMSGSRKSHIELTRNRERYEREELQRSKKLGATSIDMNGELIDIRKNAGVAMELMSKKLDKEELKKYEDSMPGFTKAYINFKKRNNRKIEDRGLDKNGSLLDRLLAAKNISDKYTVLVDQFTNISSKPAELLTKVLKKADEQIYSFIYGNETGEKDETGKPITGFFNSMIFNMKNSFNQFNNWMDEKILEPLKQKLGVDSFGGFIDKLLGKFGTSREGIRNKVVGESVRNADGSYSRSGGFLSDTINETKSMFSKAGKYISSSTKDVYGGAYRTLKESMMSPEDIKAAQQQKQKDIKKATNDTYKNDPDGLEQWARQNSSILSDSDARSIMNKAKSIRKNRKGESINRKTAISSAFKTFSDSSYLDYATSHGLLEQQGVQAEIKRINNSPRGVKANKFQEPEKTNVFGTKGTISILSDIRGFVKNIASHIGANSIISDSIIPGNAFGSRLITKSGLTAISAGEMIIPSPYNKKRELSNEKNIRRRGARSLSNYFENSIGINNEGTADGKKLAAEINDNSASFEPIGNGGGFSGAILNLADSAKYVNMRLFGSNPADEMDSIAKEVIAKAKDNIPQTVAAGLLGGTVSLVSGMIGGPLLGVAVGAAANIVARSEKLQAKLFGEKDEAGNFTSKGVIPPEMQKVLPDMGKFGVAGAVAGLVTPFGLVGGALLGGTVGYLKHNERIQEALFGEEDGLLSKDRKEKIKKAMPNIAVGALSGLFLGPFGLIGNAALGAGLGMVSTTGEFKDFLFGEEDKDGNRVGGLVGALKDGVVDPLKEFAKDMKERLVTFVKQDMIDPLKEAIKPIAKSIGLGFTRIFKTIPDMLNNTFEKALGQPLSEWIKEKIISPGTKLAGLAFKAATLPAKLIATAPVKAISGVGNMLKRSHIRSGNATYMTAEERLQYRTDHPIMSNSLLNKINPFTKGDKFIETDKQLAGMDLDSAQEARDILGYIRGGDTFYKKDEKKSMRSLYKNVDQFFDNNRSLKTGMFASGNRTKILKAIKEGNLEKAQKYIGQLRGKDGDQLNAPKYEELTKLIKSDSEKMANIKARKNTVKGTKQDMVAKLRELGLTKIKSSNLGKYEKLMGTEVKSRKDEMKDEDTATKVLDASMNQNTDRIVSVLRGIQASLMVTLGGNIDANDLEGIDPRQAKKLMKHIKKRDAVYGDKIHNFTKVGNARASALKEYYGDEVNFDDDLKNDHLTKNYDNYEFLRSSAKAGKKYDIKDVMGLDNSKLDKVKKLTELMPNVPKSSIMQIANMDDKAFGNVFKLLKSTKGSFNILNKDNTGLDDEYINSIAGVNDGREIYSAKNKIAPTSKFGKFRDKYKDLKNSATSGSMFVKTDMQYIAEFSNAGMMNQYGITIEFIKKTPSRRLDWILEHPNTYKDKYNKELSKTSSNGEIEGSATEGNAEIIGGGSPTVTDNVAGAAAIGKSKNVFQHVYDNITGKFGKYRKTKNGELEAAEGQNNAQIAAARAKELTLREKTANLGESIKNTMSRLLGLDKTKDEKDSFLSKFFSKFKKTMIWWTGISAIPLIYKYLKEKAGPYVKDKYEKYIQPKIGGISDKLSELVVLAKKGFNWFTGQEEFSGAGLPSKIMGGISQLTDWISGSGTAEGSGFPAVFSKKIVPFYAGGLEFALGKMLPITIKVLAKVMPSLLKSTALTIGNLFSNSISSLFGNKAKKSKKNAEIVEQTMGSSETKSIKIQSSTPSKAYNELKSMGFKDYSNDDNMFDTMLNTGISQATTIDEKMEANESSYKLVNPLDGQETMGENLLNTATRMGLRGKVPKFISNVASNKGLVSSAIGATGRLMKKIPLVGHLGSAALTSGSRGLAKTFGTVAEFGARKLPTAIVGTAAKATALEKLKEKAAGKVIKEAGESVVKEGAENIVSGTATAALKSAATKGAVNVVAETAETVVTKEPGLLGKILKVLKKAISGITNNKFFHKGLKEAMEEGGEKVTKAAFEVAVKAVSAKLETAITKAIKNSFGKMLAKQIAKLSTVVATGGLAGALFAVADFITGMADARNILGLIKNKNIKISGAERVVAGLIKSANGILTFGLVPEELLVNIFIDTIGSALGISDSLKDRREKSANQLYEINAKALAEDPDAKTYDTVQEYNNSKKFTTKVKNKIVGWAKGLFGGKKKKKKGVETTETTSVTNTELLSSAATGNVQKVMTLSKNGDAYDQLDEATNNTAMSIPTIVAGAAKKAISAFKGIIDKFKNTKEEKSEREKLEKKIKAGDLSVLFSDYLNVKNLTKTGDPIEKLGDFTDFYTRLLSSPLLLIKGVFGKLTGVFADAKKWLGDAGSAVADFFGFGSKNNTKLNAASGKGSGNYGKGAGFFSQKDPRYNMQYNKSGDSVRQTMSDSGCGPTVAATVANRLYGTGSPDPVEAAKFALNHGYKETNGGTRPEFFNSYLSKYGIDTQKESKSTISSKLNNGQPVILMGKASGNYANTPFGPSPHYIVATGKDSSGNIIVQDPESRTPNSVYNYNQVVKDSSIAMSAAKSKKATSSKSRFGRGVSSLLSSNMLNSAKFGMGTNPYATNPNYIANQDLKSFSMPTAAEMNTWLSKAAAKGSPFIGKGQMFIDISRATGYDPRYIVAHAAIESYWGLDEGSVRKNNYFGWGAYDSAPSASSTFDSVMQTAMIQTLNKISTAYYINRKLKTLHQMRYNKVNFQYCTSTSWVGSISTIMASAPTNTQIKYIEKLRDADAGSTISNVAVTSAMTGAESTNGAVVASSSSGVSTIFDTLSAIGKSMFGKVGDLLFGSSSTTTDSKYDTGNALNTSDAAAYLESIARGLIGKVQYELNTGNVLDPVNGGKGDCADFTQMLYKQIGVDIGGRASPQFDNSPFKIYDKNGLSPSDLVFFDSPPTESGYSSDHVGMYLGNGDFIHNNKSNSGISVNNLGSYNVPFVGGGRYLINGTDYTVGQTPTSLNSVGNISYDQIAEANYLQKQSKLNKTSSTAFPGAPIAPPVLTNSNSIFTQHANLTNLFGDSYSDAATTPKTYDYKTAETVGGNSIAYSSAYGSGNTAKFGMGSSPASFAQSRKIANVIRGNYGRGAASTTSQTVVAANPINVSGSSLNSASLIKLVQVIISVLSTIAGNTNKLNDISTILEEKLGVKISSTDSSSAVQSKVLNSLSSTGSSSKTGLGSVVQDSDLETLTSVMLAIAKH